MSAVLVHDVVTLGFLLPFACMCFAEVAFNYTVYPLFITHALIFHMAFDLAWMFIQPTIIPNLRGFIAAHHFAALSLLLHPIVRPEESQLVAYSGLIEFDTSLLLLRRLFKGSKLFNRMYLISNVVLRVWYETLLTILFWNYFKYEEFWLRLHIMSGQIFINLFSYGICVMTYTKQMRIKDKKSC